jgi:hypothetical protein
MRIGHVLTLMVGCSSSPKPNATEPPRDEAFVFADAAIDYRGLDVPDPPVLGGFPRGTVPTVDDAQPPSTPRVAAAVLEAVPAGAGAKITLANKDGKLTVGMTGSLFDKAGKPIPNSGFEINGVSGAEATATVKLSIDQVQDARSAIVK